MARKRMSVGRRSSKWLRLAFIAALGVATTGVVGRVKSERRLEHWTAEQSIPTVRVITAMNRSISEDLVLPGDIRALYEAPIHARVSGYVREWRRDIGSRVDVGEVLANVDAPELDQQLEQAKGELAKAEANLQIAKLTSKRWSALRGPMAVSQQSIDEKVSDVNAKDAEVASAKANVERLKALENFTRITAPFAGIVTARNIDVGALVSSESGAGKELFRVADIHQVRVYVRVPQVFSSQLHAGMWANLKLPQYPDKIFKAKLATTSNSISLDSRTLLAQLLADNPSEYLLPGSFVEVHFELPASPHMLRVPATALMIRNDKVQLATVGTDDKVLMKTVEVSRDLGSEVEIASGIGPRNRIIADPAESLADGDQVRIAEDSDVEPRKMTVGKRDTQGQAE